MTQSLRGVCAAVITPLDAQLLPDAEKAVAYYAALLRSGCDSLNVLGTTGEAMSLSADERLGFMEAIAASGLPRDRMMVGTGAAALRDCVRLTEAAFRLGFAAALVMPPFFFRGVSDEGITQFFGRLFESVVPPPGGVLLYNFPAVTGITFHAELVNRLVESYPGCIGGVKDSSNDAKLQAEIASRNPNMLVFPSSEAFLSDARKRGYAGCISGTVALWPELAARVWNGDSSAQNELTKLRESVAHGNLISAVRSAMAQRTGDRSWQRCLPPLMPPSAERSP